MKKTAEMGLFLALALILSYVESLLPLSFGIPGVKLGLPNLIVVLLLYRGDARQAGLINFLRIMLSGFCSVISMGSYMRWQGRSSALRRCF